ncbi:MAG: transglutaminase domain-containing protein, partial [Rubrivivax sp.]|nr:transglutaminase domain-containing protein [Rubrivivax sp.]
MSTNLDTARAVAGPVALLLKIRWWRLAWLCSAAAFALALGAVGHHLGSGAELVRLRNALLIDFGASGSLDWQPPATPRGFRTDGPHVDPYFADIARQLRLAEMATDWERSVAISEHLLGQGTRPRTEHAAKASLQGTHVAIVRGGRGYCADYVRVFTAIANAAGMTVRLWAFSFDGFGGHGHVWPEVWNRQRGAWELVGVFNNNYFTLGGSEPLSALEFRQALLQNAPGLAIHRLDELSPPGMPREEVAWSYYRRGLKQWYLWWGSDVVTYDTAPAVRLLRPLGRSLEQFAGVVSGVHPRMRVLLTPDNQREVAAMERLLWKLRALAAAGLALAATSVLWWWAWRRQRMQRAGPAGAAVRGAASVAGGDTTAAEALPRIAVYASLFPSASQPTAGLFIRERMFRMRPHAPIVVVSPQPWFPLQFLIRRFVPGYRPPTPKVEVQDGVTVHFPRFLSVPGTLRWLDGLSMALCTLPLMRRLRREAGVGIIDAHFAYP